MAEATKQKTPQQVIFDLLSMLVDNKPEHKIFLDQAFGGRRLEEKFLVHEPEKGKFLVLQETDGGVVQYVDAGAVRAALTKFTRQLPSTLEHFKLTDKMKSAVDYWMHAAAPITEEIHPVLQNGEPGRTFRRLDFDAFAMETPLFDDFIAHMETNAPAFLAFCGSLFDSTAQRQNYVWLHGQGNDGKSTWARFLHKIFGTAFAPLSDDTKMHNQFWTYQCVGKRVGVFSDCTSSKFVSSGLFQQITGDDVVPCERKGKDVVGIRLPTMFFFLSNNLPEISTKRSALRRAIICTMRERGPDELKDPHTYEERLWQERAGIVHKCLAAWRAMKEATGRITVEEKVAVEIAEGNEEDFEALLYSYFSLEAGARTRKAEVFKLLTTETKAAKRNIFDFYAWLERRHGVKSSVQKMGGVAARVLVGIKFSKAFEYYAAPEEAEEGQTY